MIPKVYSFQSFLDSGLEGIPSLVGGLQFEIEDMIQIISNSVLDSSAKAGEFIVLCENIGDQLNSMGHDLVRLDSDQDINYEENRQYFQQHFSGSTLQGLQLDLTPAQVDIRWNIVSASIFCPNCQRPGGRKRNFCQYCGVI